MPVVLRIGPDKFFFFSLENGEPPHIHVQRDRDVAKFWLDPVALASNRRYPEHEINACAQTRAGHRDLLLRAWNEYFSSTND